MDMENTLITRDVSNTTADPYRKVVRVSATYTDGSTATGTGVVVGTNDVLTAAHMVYGGGAAAVSVTVYPAQNGYTYPYGQFTTSRYSYNKVDIDGDGLIYNYESQKDYAILGFKERIGDITGTMPLDTDFYSGTATVAGYPAKYDYHYMHEDSGSVYYSGGIVYTSGVEINAGNSGGPVWAYDKGTPEVVGIVSTRSWAVAVKNVYSTIKTWMGLNDDMMTPTTPTTPTSYFNESYYLNSKAKALGNGWTFTSVKNAIASTGMTPEQHYHKYGAFEGDVNPSLYFNDDVYYASKSRQCGMPITDIQNAFRASNLDPVQHYLAYGKNEGLQIV